MPTDKSRNNRPTPKNIDANKLINISLRISPVLLNTFGRDTTKTKNQDVKKVPIINNTVAKCGNTDGLIGNTCRDSDSISYSKLNE